MGLIPCDADVVAFSALNKGWEIPRQQPRVPFFMTHATDQIIAIRPDGRKISACRAEDRYETQSTTWIFQKAK